MRITLLTATMNPGTVLTDCLESAAEQVLPEGVCLHHHIIDGGSSDGTQAALQSWSRGNPNRTFRSRRDGGFYEALNSGIQETQGEIVGILNADDFYFDREVLKRVIGVFENPSVSGVYGDLVYVGSGDQRDRFQIKRFWKAGEYRRFAFRNGWMPPHPTVFVRREVYEESGMYKTNFGTAADYEWMLRAIYKPDRQLAYIPHVLVAMRAGGMSNQSLRARLMANSNDRRAWLENQIPALPWTFLMKPLRKIPQWWCRPKQ